MKTFSQVLNNNIDKITSSYLLEVKKVYDDMIIKKIVSDDYYVEEKYNILYLAIEKGNLFILQFVKDVLLFSKGDFLRKKNKILYFAIFNDQMKMINILLDDFDYELDWKNDINLVTCALYKGDIKMFDILLSKLDKMSYDKRNKTINNLMLTNAAMSGKLEVVKYFKEALHINRNDICFSNSYMLSFVIYNGHVDIFRYFKEEFGLEYKDIISKKEKYISQAKENNHIELYDYLTNEFAT